MHRIDTYLDQKGAATSPPPPVGVSIHPNPESMVCPGAAQGFRGSTRIPSEPSIYAEYRKASGICILQLYFYILHG